jgi:hypothetical protein
MVACSDTSNSGASPVAVAKSELRIAISRFAVACVDSMIFTRDLIVSNQPGLPSGPGMNASERPCAGFMMTVMLSAALAAMNGANKRLEILGHGLEVAAAEAGRSCRDAVQQPAGRAVSPAIGIEQQRVEDRRRVLQDRLANQRLDRGRAIASPACG